MMSTYMFMLKSTVSYLLQGKRLPSWDLRLQVLCDTYRHIAETTYPKVAPEDAEALDLVALHRSFQENQMPVSEFPASKGVYRQMDIPVSAISIDRELLKGIGVAEAPFIDLVNRDMSSNRSLLYELVAAWNVADRLGVERGDSLLSPVPLIPNEQVILYLHGGAYIKGSPSSHRKLVGRVSGNTGLRAFALDYRLAPGNPFPAQLHDAYIAFHYLVMQGFKKEDIVLMGDSAGGHLCLTLFVLLRHTGLHPVRGMVLLSPLPGIHLRGQSLQTNAAYDYLCPLLLDIPTSSQRLLYKPGHMLTDEYLHEVGDPLLTPANGSLAQLPPTLIQSGSKEVLVDDIRELCDKARSENQEARVVYEEYEDMVHVFQRFEFREESKRAYEAIGDFVRSL